MDEAKNMALLFFMDHLMQKNGRRTIHDLSCQFGARGFSQEMRDSVGATQEGLTDFLMQHPSLFTVDGDQVTLKGFGEMDNINHLMNISMTGRKRDYTAEAVDFFVAKLEKFGPELQIKSLLGHRSQAAPEVRLVSGRHLREFYDFLESQTKYFVVEGDRVRLANMPEPKIIDETNILDDEGRPLAGIKAKQASVEFLKGILEQNEDTPIPLDTFYKRFCERFPHSVRQDVATNPKELLQFLKLNRNIFFIRSNKVSLVRNRDDGNGSESGRSTESVDSSFSTNAQNSISIENNNIFLLNIENINRIQLVKALKTAQEVVNKIINDLNNNNNLQQEKFICIDFKLVTLSSNYSNGNGNNNGAEDFLSMICIATTNRIAIFDMAHSDSLLTESGLKELLESASVLKVIHDVKRVATLLAQRYAVNMIHIFDTQIAHTIIQHEKFNKPLSELHAISFINLQRVYYPQSLMMSDITPRKLSQTPNWTQRPIQDELILSAAEECHCLMSALYRNVCSKLPESHQKLFEMKCLEALVPTPTRPPPLISTTNTISANVNPISNNGIIRFNGLSTNSIITVSKINNNDGFNGIYRPPARRRLAEAAAVSSNSTTTTTHNQSLNSNFPPNNNSIKNNLNSQFQCQCQCQQQKQQQDHLSTNLKSLPKMIDSSTQTISTGEITVLNIYYD